MPAPAELVRGSCDFKRNVCSSGTHGAAGAAEDSIFESEGREFESLRARHASNHGLNINDFSQMIISDLELLDVVLDVSSSIPISVMQLKYGS